MEPRGRALRCLLVRLKFDRGIVDESTMPHIPQIPGYELLTELGGGALTVAWEARPIAADRRVVVKIPRLEAVDGDLGADLIRNEAAALRSVAHPNLVRFVQADLDGPLPYLVTEFVAGESLRRRMQREGCLSISHALAVARQCALALAALHRHHFVHGDVKPENLVTCDDGGVVLIDLGFAHRAGEAPAGLSRGLLLGTANYLAPEQCSDPPASDEKSDVFSLGVMLFEMLDGELPYPLGNVAETLRLHRQERPRPMSRPVSKDLGQFVHSLMAPHRVERPTAYRAAQLIVELEIATWRQAA